VRAAIRGMSAFRLLTAVMLLAFATPAPAPFVTLEQLCAQGNQNDCRLVELEKKIDLHMFDEGREYKLALGPHALWSMLRPGPQKRALERQALCTFFNEVYLGPTIEEYARRSDMRTVNRQGFETCMEVLK
jgi:hypothetical protein